QRCPRNTCEPRSHRCVWCVFFFFSSRRRHTRSKRDWSSDVCSSDLIKVLATVKVQTVTKNLSIVEVAKLNSLEVITRKLALNVEIGRAACRERAKRWEVDGEAKRKNETRGSRDNGREKAETWTKNST